MTFNIIRRTVLGLVVSFTVLAPLNAQEQLVTPNYVGTEIRAIIQAVSTVTGRNFIIDPRVRQEVTMISSTPMSPDAFYEAFLSILQVHGYAAVPTGDVIKIIPDASVRSFRIHHRALTTSSPRSSRWKTWARPSSCRYCGPLFPSTGTSPRTRARIC